MSTGSFTKRVVSLTDWLAPEFSAVSQYAVQIAEEEAALGADVLVVGISSLRASREERQVGKGRVRVTAFLRSHYNKDSWSRRLAWIFKTNGLLVARSWRQMRDADEIRFTGSPPFLIYFLCATNLVLRKRLIYRITDFYPECIIAALPRRSLALDLALRSTRWLRRRIDAFEVIGNDVKRRLAESGVSEGRVTLRRDASPVSISDTTLPLPRPGDGEDRKLLLYSGNFGVAHDVSTFRDGYKRHHRAGSGSVMLWLNATGSGAERLDADLRAAGVPFIRQALVPLEQLANLLVTPDAHLVTLRDEFCGYVLPSKVYGCLASGRDILFIGPTGSDVHELCAMRGIGSYDHVHVGDVAGVEAALEKLGARPSTSGSSVAHCASVSAVMPQHFAEPAEIKHFSDANRP